MNVGTFFFFFFKYGLFSVMRLVHFGCLQKKRKVEDKNRNLAGTRNYSSVKNKTKQNNVQPVMILKRNTTILDEWKDNNWIVKLRKSPRVCKILEFNHPETHQVMELSCFILANYANALISFVCGVTEWRCLIFHHLGCCCRRCQELHLCPPLMRSSDSQWT